MKKNPPLRSLRISVAVRAAALCGSALLVGSLLPVAAADVAITAKPPATTDGLPYSSPTSTKYPQRVYWGDTHLHTDNSFDAGLMGTRLGPEDAFRFARGDEVVSSTGVPVKLHRPYDFLVVSDHSDYMGLPLALIKGDPALLADPVGKKWYTWFHTPGPVGFKVFSAIMGDILHGKPSINVSAIQVSAWHRAVAAAEKYNDPGHFTAFIGYEWSANPGGDNLHRNVIFRDNADKALQILPLPAFDDPDPEHLWAYLDAYQKKTGGQVLAIPHNSNLSGGMMFSDHTFGGKALDRAYAEARAKWEPDAEITQTKGDSETDPSVSPDDEFANFERWDKANIMGTKADTPEQQPANYLRPTLTRGLSYTNTIGANPFKYGLVGGSDEHTGISTVDADNFFGQMPEAEPNSHRLLSDAVIKLGKIPMPGINQSASGGISAVWATENTRAAIFDAFRRKEVYATTGPRITVRVFAGWDFKPGDETRSDFAPYGYAHGVPMGGDLSDAHQGQSPTLVIQAAKVSDGANLDRVQVIKGWVDDSGATHEKIFDVAWSGNRAAGSDGKLPLVGNTVDVKTATYSNSIGAPVLTTAWRDPQFNPGERSYYYLRVIEIPTPRWTTYDAVRFGEQLPADVPATVTQRAYTSPIWYTPNPAGRS
jgi:predicted RecA/RadA family phage recombinase